MKKLKSQFKINYYSIPSVKTPKTLNTGNK